ncbi:MAG TPA: hypothetical protein VGG06_06670 [Thermoanaerobaculia bacterium]|jgi:hypothetical protein
MTRIHAQLLGPNVVLPQSDWERLLVLARRSDEVEVRIDAGDVSTTSLMKLAEQGGAFDFWRNDEEDVYTLEDGEPL